jgi:hypothetical protein
LLDVNHQKALARFFVPEVGELATIRGRRVGSAAVRAGRQLQLLAWLLKGWHGVLSLNKRRIASTAAVEAAAMHAHEKSHRRDSAVAALEAPREGSLGFIGDVRGKL